VIAALFVVVAIAAMVALAYALSDKRPECARCNHPADQHFGADADCWQSVNRFRNAAGVMTSTERCPCKRYVTTWEPW
jgi:hypothetical protein